MIIMNLMKSFSPCTYTTDKALNISVISRNLQLSELFIDSRDLKTRRVILFPIATGLIKTHVGSKRFAVQTGAFLNVNRSYF